ncbi:DM13 domain-containing protein [Streptomyces sp. NPDC026673]|uniref:DM13 domain-containing protein n=1 Tax=Streptomyces sp. NPDC026673 TaxID=3155724 RepID=UPI00341049C3
MTGILALLRRHLRLVVAACVVVAALGVFVLVYFQPQKLFVDETVNDPPPAATATATATAGERPESAGTAAVLSTGELISRGHPGSGTVRVLRLPDGSRVLRLEDLRVENGPDLRVRLTVAGPRAPNGDFGRDFADLGALKGNLGNQTYALPAGLRLDRYHAVVIWCRRFTYAFAAAPLSSAAGPSR